MTWNTARGVDNSYAHILYTMPSEPSSTTNLREGTTQLDRDYHQILNHKIVLPTYDSWVLSREPEG